MRVISPSRIRCLLVLWAFCSSPAWAVEDAFKNMALIPGGAYEMGSMGSMHHLNPLDVITPDLHMGMPPNTAHEVEIGAFYMDIHETTNEEYKEFVLATSAREPEFWGNPDFKGPRQPVVGINWDEANAYCQWRKKRLPTEAEWEKASRGKRPVRFPWGDEAPDSTRANFNNEVQKPQPVGSYEAGKSDYGVYDLAGNVAEWVNDWYMPEFYLFSPKKNPQGPKRRPYKTIRGGNFGSPGQDLEMTLRNASAPNSRVAILGFRCAKTAPAE
jgi:formylglycine-generating enzyme required for sulfatase activity